MRATSLLGPATGIFLAGMARFAALYFRRVTSRPRAQAGNNRGHGPLPQNTVRCAALLGTVAVPGKLQFVEI